MQILIESVSALKCCCLPFVRFLQKGNPFFAFPVLLKNWQNDFFLCKEILLLFIITFEIPSSNPSAKIFWFAQNLRTGLLGIFLQVATVVFYHRPGGGGTPSQRQHSLLRPLLSCLYSSITKQWAHLWQNTLFRTARLNLLKQ